MFSAVVFLLGFALQCVFSQIDGLPPIDNRPPEGLRPPPPLPAQWWDDSLVHPIETLTEANFHEKVNNGSYWFVVFSMREDRDQYDRLMTYLRPYIVYGFVDAQHNRKLVEKDQGISIIPTVKIFHGPSRIDEEIVSLSSDEIIARTLAAIPDNINFVTNDNFDSFFSDNYPKTLLISDKPEPTPVYKQLSLSFEHRMRFGFVSVQSLDDPIAKKSMAFKLPWLFATTKSIFNASHLLAFNGTMEGEALSNLTFWLIHFVDKAERRDPRPVTPQYSIPLLTPLNFDKIINGRTSSLLVAFFKNGRSLGLEGVHKFSEKSQKGLVENPLTITTYQVDCKANLNFCLKHDIIFDPTVRLFIFPTKKKKTMSDYVEFAGIPTTQNILNFIRESRGRVEMEDPELNQGYLVRWKNEL